MKGIKKLAFRGAASIVYKVLCKPNFQRIIFNAIRLNRPEVSKFLLNETISFLTYCLSRRHYSRSQIMQDLWVCFELGETRGGFFVEFGATNGLTNSNTWILEKKLGWNGILAEPNPFWHSDLASNRSVHIEHKCVSSKSGDIVTFLTTDDSDPELSGMATFATGDHFAELRSQGNTIRIETISLDDMLDKYDAPSQIDYISIDTEGSELEILSKYNFSKRRFKLISVEINKNTDIEIQTLLQKNGYFRVFAHLSQWDAWYVSKELRENTKPEIFAPAA